MAAMPLRMLTLSCVMLALAFGAQAQDKTVEDGKYLGKDGNPTYNVGQDGTVGTPSAASAAIMQNAMCVTGRTVWAALTRPISLNR